MSPCSAAALKPCRLSEVSSSADRRLAVGEDDGVLDVRLRSAADRAARRAWLWHRAAHAPARWSMLAAVLDGGDASMRIGIVQELAGDALDLGRHGGREEQRLAREGQKLADALDVGNEAHVEHAVGLVDDQHFDAGEQAACRARNGRADGRAWRSRRRRRDRSWRSCSSKETPPISSATVSL